VDLVTEPHHGVANTTLDRSTSMNLYTTDLARAHVTSRLEQARAERLGHQLTTARRLTRRAERAASRVRLALARVA
jgi:hypothetical protein